MANTKRDYFLDKYGLGNTINGDNVAGFIQPSKVKNLAGMGDYTNVMTYLTSGKTDKEQMEKYLGFFTLFKTTHKEEVPMVADIVGDMAVFNVEDYETITYDIPIPQEARSGAISLEDTTSEVDGEIVAGQVFRIVLDRKFVPGDRLKFDTTSPFQVMVSREHDITPSGEGFSTYVVFESNNPRQTFPKSALAAGREWTRIAHPLAEYSTTWASPSGGLNSPGKIRLEVSMPSPQGIEVAYSMRGGNIRTDRIADLSRQTVEELQYQLDKLGGFEEAGAFFLGRVTERGLQGKAKVSTALEYLAVKELLLMNSYTNMFATASEEATADGVVRIGEGVWFQRRRGKVITYPRTLQIKHLQEASSYVVGNSASSLNNVHIEFVGGREACAMGWELLRDYANTSINNLPDAFFGQRGVIKGNLVEGKDLDNLKLNQIRFGEVFIPSVGYVSFRHDPSFDYQPLRNKIDAGYTAGGYNNLSYCLMVDSVEMRNNNTFENIIGGAKLMDGGNKNSNFYYLKPDNHFWWGRNYGRMNDGDKFTDLRASLRYMGNEFFAAIQSYILMVDTTATVIIERQNTYDY